MSVILDVVGLEVRFGGVRAVAGVDLQVRRGELLGLIGPNGAGKTTCIDAMCGFVGSTGSVVLDGQDMSRLPPHARAVRGLARTWQAGDLFDDLTVRENLEVAAVRSSLTSAVRDLVRRRPRVVPRVADLLEELELTAVAERPAGELTEGQRKLAGVGRALAGDPHVVLLDEPAAGLDTHESVRLGRTLRTVVDRGTSMVLVDHDMSLVMSTCDRIVVLDFGTKIAEGTPEQVRADPQVLRAYLGSTAESVRSDAGAQP